MTIKNWMIPLTVALFFLTALPAANAQVVSDQLPMQIEFSFSIAKVISAAIAFGTAAIASGFAIAKAGAAAVAASAENPEVRTHTLIITALAEAVAIYGIVIAILILGQSG